MHAQRNKLQKFTLLCLEIVYIVLIFYFCKAKGNGVLLLSKGSSMPEGMMKP